MAIEIDNGEKALSMRLVNIDTKHEMLLYEPEGSRCFFNNGFEDLQLVHKRIN